MKVRMSRHAITRMTQRAISGEMVQTIWEYGENLDAPGGATKVVLSRRIAKKLREELEQEIRKIDRTVDKAIVVNDDDGSILTCMHNTKRLG